MAHYLVVWEIDIEADTPEEAARAARGYQTNPNTSACVFDVFDLTGDRTRIDLLEKEAAK